MQWDNVQHGCHSRIIRDTDDATIRERIVEFWKAFAADVILRIDPDLWDYILIDIRGVDGGVGVYPQHTLKPPFEVPWAHLGLNSLGHAFNRLTEEELGGERAKEINQAYSSMLLAAAEDVGLARLCGRTDGLLFRFVAYTEDQEPPFREQII